MNIIILSGSPRKGGNTDLLAESFADAESNICKYNEMIINDITLF